MDELKAFGIPVFNKEYFTTRSGKEGYIEKPFNKLSDKLISYYTEESKRDVKYLHPILESSPDLIEDKNDLSMWSSIYRDLNSLGISHDLLKTYNYKGGVFTLRFYLEARGGVENNALMGAVAYAINIALEKTYYLYHKDIEGLARVVDSAYFSGKTTAFISYQNEIIAGGSRTGDATEAKIKLKKKRIETTRIKAIELRDKYPEITKDAIAELIYNEVGLSFRTVRDYLKKIYL